jgi:hypothetical protein
MVAIAVKHLISQDFYCLLLPCDSPQLAAGDFPLFLLLLTIFQRLKIDGN